MRRRSEKPANSWIGQLHNPYILINLILASIIAGVMGYSALFSPKEDKYPIPCTHQMLTGQTCPTCGLSHSFSSMLRLKFEEAQHYSPFGPHIFVFFASQLLLRCMFSMFWILVQSIRNKLVWLDVSAAVLLFAWAFAPLLNYLIHTFTH
jgi:hypothetical protein